jgi:adhesin transport system outer membrane protein
VANDPWILLTVIDPVLAFLEPACCCAYKNTSEKCFVRIILLVALVLIGPSQASLAQAGALPSLIEGVLAEHPSIRAQKAIKRSSVDAVSAAQWQFYPTPSVGLEQVNASATDISYRSGDKRVTTLRLQQPLWSGGRLSAGVSKAQAGVLVSDAQFEGTRQDLALRVVQTYADWYGGYYKSVAFDKSLKTHLRLKAQIGRRIEEGISPASDLTLVQGRIEQTQAELTSAFAQQASALSQLSQLLGKPLFDKDLTQAVSFPLALGALPDILAQAQAGNPNIVKLIATARAQEAEIDERKADMQPEVYLRAERQFGNYSYLNAVPENRVFIGVSTRFGAGLSSLSQVSAAQARLDAALADVESTRISLAQQISSDYLLTQSSDVRLHSLDASLRSAELITLAWGRQFLSGQKSWLDVMNAARELAQVEVQIADVHASQLLQTWRLSIFSQGVDAVIDPSKPKVAWGIAPPAAVETPLVLLFDWALSTFSQGLNALTLPKTKIDETVAL